MHYPTYNRSQSAVATTLHPAFITGFSDAESCFNINITKSKTHKIGWVVQLCFIISLHKKDTALLEQIKYSFPLSSQMTEMRRGPKGELEMLKNKVRIQFSYVSVLLKIYK